MDQAELAETEAAFTAGMRASEAIQAQGTGTAISAPSTQQPDIGQQGSVT